MRFPITGVLRVAVAAGLAAGLVALADAHPRTVSLSEPVAVPSPGSSTAATVPLPTRVLTCPGQELTGTDGVPDVALTGDVVAVSLPEGLRPSGVSGEGSVTITDPLAAESTSVAAAAQLATLPLPTGSGAVLVRGQGALAPGAMASQEWSSDTPALRGLATTACPTAAADLWLIAGGGAPGRQERLVLTNPGANEVSASIEVFGAQGKVAGAADRGVVVPAAGRAVLLVDALAPSEPTPVVHVVVSAGVLAATLTDTWLEGSVPAGAETTGPTTPPALTQVMPVSHRSQAGAVRIAVPGSDQAVVSARLLTASGPVPLASDGGGAQLIQGGSVLELAVPGGADDIVGVEVSSDVPVLAAAVSVARADGAVGDFAWSAAGAPITQLAGVALNKAGPPRRLNLVATGGSASARVVVLADGAVTTTEVSVPSDSALTTDLGSVDAVWVQRVGGDGELRGGLLAQSGTGAAALISSVTLAELPLTTAATTAIPLP